MYFLSLSINQSLSLYIYIYIYIYSGAYGLIAIVERNGHGQPSSSPEGDFLHITVRNRRTSRDHPNHSIFKIGQNTKKAPGDLMRILVTQIPVKDH